MYYSGGGRLEISGISFAVLYGVSTLSILFSLVACVRVSMGKGLIIGILGL